MGHKKSLLDQAGDYVETVRPQIEAAVASARDTVEDFVETTAKPAIADARDKAGPALSDAKAKATPVIADARAKTLPVLATGAAVVAEKARHTADLADAKATALQAAATPEKKSRRWLRIALLALLAGIAGFAAKKRMSDAARDDWQSDFSPTTGAGSEETDDTGGAGPGEAVADAVEEPHGVTTPDDPAEVVDIDRSDDDR